MARPRNPLTDTHRRKIVDGWKVERACAHDLDNAVRLLDLRIADALDEGASGSEVADLLNVSRQTVYARAARARQGE